MFAQKCGVISQFNEDSEDFIKDFEWLLFHVTGTIFRNCCTKILHSIP